MKARRRRTNHILDCQEVDGVESWKIGANRKEMLMGSAAEQIIEILLHGFGMSAQIGFDFPLVFGKDRIVEFRMIEKKTSGSLVEFGIIHNQTGVPPKSSYLFIALEMALSTIASY